MLGKLPVIKVGEYVRCLTAREELFVWTLRVWDSESEITNKQANKQANKRKQRKSKQTR